VCGPITWLGENRYIDAIVFSNASQIAMRLVKYKQIVIDILRAYGRALVGVNLDKLAPTGFTSVCQCQSNGVLDLITLAIETCAEDFAQLARDLILNLNLLLNSR